MTTFVTIQFAKKGVNLQMPAECRLRITNLDLNKYGYSDTCPRRRSLEIDETTPIAHSEACRRRIYAQLEQEDDPKLRHWQTRKLKLQ